ASGLWRQAARAAEPRRDAPILVVLELSGGNDGLNTVIPHADDVYHKSRPTLRVEPGKVLELDDHVGLHPSLKDLHRLWETGELAVVQGVGYPDPNRSHFRSMEIWQTGTVGPAPPAGWLGRLGDAHPPLELCHVGQGSMPLAVQGRKVVAQSLASVAAYRLGSGAELRSRFKEESGKPPLAEIRQRYTSSVELARRLEILRGGKIASGDAETLEGRLETIRSLIEADTPCRVYCTAQDGFDTHAGQLYAHQQLLQTMGKALAGFLDSLKPSKLDERVVVLVFSEFGRRLKENANCGTDHGAAAPVLIAGRAVKGGLFGPHPNLADLDETGDPRFAVDFRDRYASLIRRWLDVDPTPILGERKSTMILV
ncbi:MAG: DUF1501 domain-containing protein, partial [Isosphaeraceae bacterium]